MARFFFYPPQSKRRHRRYWISRLRSWESVRQLRAHVSVAPGSKLLDLGCGDGVLAFPLARLLGPQGEYRGIDLQAEWITWLQENVTPRWPNFRFDLIDIRNSYYNPSGAIRPREVRFPYPGDYFDVVVANHVLMYLLAEELTQYLAEIYRMTAPGGVCYATAFIVDDPDDADVIERRYSEHHHGHPRALLTETAARLGFRRCEVLPGRWRRIGFAHRRNEIRHRGDTLVLTK